LAWDPNDPNIDPDLAGYRVHYGNVSRTYLGGYQNSVELKNVTTYTLTGLDPSKTYYIAVTAYDTFNNQSDYSNEVKRMSFSDVPVSYYWPEAYNSIITISDMGITEGCRGDNPATPETEGLFCPDANVTRAQMAAFIIRAWNQSPSSAPFNEYFNDILNDFSSPYINKMWELEITSGCGTRLYCPDNSLTRAEMAVFIIRALNEIPSAVSYNAYFDDIPDDFFTPFINRIRELGITLGCGTRTYCPGNYVTREQMAVFLTRAPGLL
jgi:hypothetical protein